MLCTNLLKVIRSCRFGCGCWLVNQSSVIPAQMSPMKLAEDVQKKRRSWDDESGRRQNLWVPVLIEMALLVRLGDIGTYVIDEGR